mmetsp:Transcript_68809/g.77008  ORF Transcript_68809/g.77008 Transcript_68809/m.77008 type:complete len:102 (-) Transcript_68809:5-310(-)
MRLLRNILLDDDDSNIIPDRSDVPYKLLSNKYFIVVTYISRISVPLIEILGNLIIILYYYFIILVWVTRWYLIFASAFGIFYRVPAGILLLLINTPIGWVL